MSTSPRSEQAWRIETADERAEVPPELSRRLRAATVAAPGLDSVGFFDHDDFVYGLSRVPGSGRWDALLRLGVRLAVAWRALDRDLQPMRTGRLIRTVLDAEGGAVFCETVRPGRHVIGSVTASATPHDRERADAALAQVVDHLRVEENLPTQNHGSFADEGTPIPDAPDPLHTTGDGAALATLTPAIRLDGLHALSYFTRTEKLAEVDCFDAPALAPFHELATPAHRRALYDTLGRGLSTLANQLNQAISPALGGRLQRIILDVQSGAIYYRRLPRQHYLVGITLDQTRVRRADHEMDALVAQLS
ncbi:hypothetical protein [Actinokineospora diospyrosa]|uniref:ESAT-6 protein secretion system EspG family protein n=1 Tax=Actinokineospora diospyrosa TaxID=103728 RepID=A0ABT1I600_9PSEU|nr:hypothetical protein [Actinokineospora diospyrosa]MCP2267826.1 hypothetical protein [Actinokineospora diospyrosa]